MSSGEMELLGLSAEGDVAAQDHGINFFQFLLSAQISQEGVDDLILISQPCLSDMQIADVEKPHHFAPFAEKTHSPPLGYSSYGRCGLFVLHPMDLFNTTARSALNKRQMIAASQAEGSHILVTDLPSDLAPSTTQGRERS